MVLKHKLLSYIKFSTKKIAKNNLFKPSNKQVPDGVSMIKPVKLINSKINFHADSKKDESSNRSAILPNTLETRVRQQFDKTTSAFTEYPRKGLKGDVNSDFYEFLAMGIVPYIIGSATFMGVFNLTKHLGPKAKQFASDYGHKMALGVLFYGIFKNLSADLITRPVAWATGVDIELPYRNVNYPLPTEAGEDATIYPMRQHRKVYDSREFFRKDLIAHHPDYGEKYYAKIAKKNGLGDNLADPVGAGTNIIQNVISTTKTAKSLSTYAWAALGVGLALQDSWTDLFKSFSDRKKYTPKEDAGFFSKMFGKIKTFGENCYDITKTFIKSFGEACESLWKGKVSSENFMKHTGKAWIIFTGLLTVGTTLNAIIRAKSFGKDLNTPVIDKAKESTVI